MTASNLAALLAANDMAGADHLVRTAVRRGMAAPLVEPLWQWLMDAWRAQPLPRLGELLWQLAPHRVQTEAAAELLAYTRKSIPHPMWNAVLRAGDDRDMYALLSTLARTVTDEVGYRIEDLQRQLGDRKHPLASSVFLEWMEAPPFRAISSQPVWNQVFDVLDQQADPRCMQAWPRLREIQFPAGATMQKWMHRMFERAQERWHGRPDASALEALCQPSAEPDIDSYDRLAEMVALITGGAVIRAGGSVGVPSVEGILGMQVPADVSPLQAGATADSVASVMARGTQTLVHEGTGRVVACHDDALLATEADGTILWADQPSASFDLSPDGRLLALRLGGVVRLVDLNSGQSNDVQAVGTATIAERPTTDYPVGSLAFDPAGDVLYGLYLEQTRSRREPAMALVSVAFDTQTLAVDAVDTRFAYQEVAHPTLWQRGLFHAGSVHVSDRWVVCQVITVSGRKPDVVFLRRTGPGQVALHGALRPARSTTQRVQMDGDTLVLRVQDRYGELEEQILCMDLQTGFARQIDIHEPSQCTHRQTAQASVLQVCAAAHRDVTLINAGSGQRLTLVRNGQPVPMHAATQNHPWHAVALSPHGDWFVAASGSSKTITRYTIAPSTTEPASPSKGKSKKPRKPKKPKAMKTRRMAGHKDPPTQVLVSRRSGRCVSLADDAILVWSSEGELQLDLRHRRPPLAMALHPDDEVLATADRAHLYLWALRQGSEVAICELPEGMVVSGLAWAPGGSDVCIAMYQSTTLFGWNPATESMASLWEAPAVITCLLGEPTAGLLAVGTAAGEVWILWPTEAGFEGRRISQHVRPIRAMAVDCDGNLLVGTARRGMRGTVVRLVPDANGSVGETTHHVHASAGNRTAIAAWVTAPDTRLTAARAAREEVLARNPKTHLAQEEVAELLKQLARGLPGIKKFAAQADDALWEQTLASIDPSPGIRDDVVFGVNAGNAQYLLSRLLVPAPAVPIVEAYRRSYATYVQTATEDVSGHVFPEVRSLTVCSKTGIADLTGFGALREVVLTIYSDVAKKKGDLEASLRSARYPAQVSRLVIKALHSTPMPNITGTPFTDVAVSNRGIKDLEPLCQAVRLEIGANDALTTLEALAGFSCLRTLLINETTLLTSLTGLDAAAAAGAQLERLEVTDASALNDISALSALPHLTGLRLDHCKGVADISAVRSPLLQHVSLAHAAVSSIDVLAPSQQTLRAVELQGCIALGSIAPLEGATALEWLDLRDCAELDDVGVLETCPALRYIALAGTRFTPNNVSPWILSRASWLAHPHERLTARARGIELPCGR